MDFGGSCSSDDELFFSDSMGENISNETDSFVDTTQDDCSDICRMEDISNNQELYLPYEKNSLNNTFNNTFNNYHDY